MHGEELTSTVDTLVDAITALDIASDGDVTATIRAALRLRATADDYWPAPPGIPNGWGLRNDAA